MLNHLKLHNFQNHRNLEFPLSQITTIIGESDTGKSAIVRSLQWLCLNSLQGDSFITHGKKKTYAQLDVDDYGTITRRRGSGVNGYVLADDEERNAIGRDVPPDIANILNIGEINIAAQHDPPFWFTLTPNQLTKELNSIADIAWLDRLMQASNANLRKVQSELDVTASRVTSLENTVKDSEYVETANTELKQLEEQHTQITALQSQCNQLTDSIDRLIEYQTIIQTANALIQHFDQITIQYTQLSQLNKQIDRLTDLVNSYPSITESTIQHLQILQQNHEQTQDDKIQLDKITNLIESYPPITESTIQHLYLLQQNHEQAQTVKIQIDRLADLLTVQIDIPISEITQLNTQCTQFKEIQTQYSRISALLSNVPADVPSIDEITQLNTQIATVQQKQDTYDQLSNMIEQLNTITEQCNDAQSQLQILEKDLHDQLDGVCPICGQAL
jgi:DNA repair ATPase RecN